MIKRIHVNQHHIKANKKNGNQDLPVFTVKTSKGNFKGHTVIVDGPSEVVYRPNSPLNCGAVAWIFTKSPVQVELEKDGYTLETELK
jgi:hypothetical protein